MSCLSDGREIVPDLNDLAGMLPKLCQVDKTRPRADRLDFMGTVAIPQKGAYQEVPPLGECVKWFPP